MNNRLTAMNARSASTRRDRVVPAAHLVAGAGALCAVLVTGAGAQPPTAGMPMETHLLLKSVEVIGCEPLSTDNAAKVTQAIARRADPEQARRVAERIAVEHAGSVVDVRVRHERTVTFSLIRPGDEPTDDTGWTRVEDAAARVYFVPETAETGCEALTPGSRWRLTQDPRIDCDTAPPVGLCVFDAVALPTPTQMQERYGEPE
jgi:hypothetical protein